MVRSSGRSRGCKTCRKRKVKVLLAICQPIIYYYRVLTIHLQCDETIPECGQCISQGQICPGPTVGAVFLAVKPDVNTQVRLEDRASSRRDVSYILNADMRNGHPTGLGITNRDASHGHVEDQIYGRELPFDLNPQPLLREHLSTDSHRYESSKKFNDFSKE